MYYVLPKAVITCEQIWRGVCIRRAFKSYTLFPRSLKKCFDSRQTKLHSSVSISFFAYIQWHCMEDTGNSIFILILNYSRINKTLPLPSPGPLLITSALCRKVVTVYHLCTWVCYGAVCNGPVSFLWERCTMPWRAAQTEPAKMQEKRITCSQSLRRQLIYWITVAQTTDLCLLPRQAVLLMRSMQSSICNKAYAQLDEGEDRNS